MTKEEALKSFEEENKDFEKIFERYGYQMTIEEASAVTETIERNKVAISALKGFDGMTNKGEWIPVSERLPKEDKEVLIFTKDKEINKAYHTLKEWSDTQWEWFVFGTLGYSLTYSDNEVLAWQPLPEPYKGESED